MDALAQELLDTIYEMEPTLVPGSYEINKVIRHFAGYVSQFEELDEARPAFQRYANVCFKQHIKYFSERASERRSLAQSVDQELRRVDLEKERQQAVEAQAESTPQVTYCNAEDIARLIVQRMKELSAQWGIAEELTSSLRNSLRPFFEQTSSTDSEYLTITLKG